MSRAWYRKCRPATAAGVTLLATLQIAAYHAPTIEPPLRTTSAMNFAIAIHGDAATSDSPRTALRFARAVLAKGHRIHRVFFYHAAVNLANSFVVQPQGEADTAADWALFAIENNVELAVCVAAGLRRGVLGAQDADRYERVVTNVRAPFQVVGLGQMIDAAVEADRFVTFCA